MGYLTADLPDVSPSLVLHIGMPKTGTSAIQSYLIRGEEQLLTHGVRYVRTGRHGDAHHLISWSLRGVNEQRVVAAGLWGDDLRPALLGELRATAEPVVIISSEALISHPLSSITFFDGLASEAGRSLVVVAYVRPQWDVVDSWYRQLVKDTDYSVDFESHVAGSPGKDYGHYFRSLGEAVSGAVVVLGYPTSGDTVQDFLARIGVERDPAVEIAGNPSLDHELTDLKRVVNPRIDAHHQQIGADMARWSLERRVPFRSLFTMSGWERLSSRFAGTNAWLEGQVGVPLGLSAATAPERFWGDMKISSLTRLELWRDFVERFPAWTSALPSTVDLTGSR